jgi:hypothetical protein
LSIVGVVEEIANEAEVLMALGPLDIGIRIAECKADTGGLIQSVRCHCVGFWSTDSAFVEDQSNLSPECAECRAATSGMLATSTRMPAMAIDSDLG